LTINERLYDRRQPRRRDCRITQTCTQLKKID